MPVIMGTAGHIDHGKTSLVKALTGINCDQLEHGTDGVIFEANDFNKTKKITQEVIEASKIKYEGLYFFQSKVVRQQPG